MTAFIVVLGMVGAGKSLQSQELARRHGWSWLSTGEVLRTSTQPLIINALQSGELLSDEIIYSVMDTALQERSQEEVIILDGFPRRLSQAAWLDAYAELWQRPIKSVLHLNINPDVALQRLRERARADDTSEGIAMRNREYNQEIKPVVVQYRHSGLLHEINTDKPVAEVAAAIDTILAKEGIL